MFKKKRVYAPLNATHEDAVRSSSNKNLVTNVFAPEMNKLLWIKEKLIKTTLRTMILFTYSPY